MSYHDNARTTMHQRQRIRQRRAPYCVQAQALGGTVATVAKWRRRRYGFERYFNEHPPYKVMRGKTPARLTQE